MKIITYVISTSILTGFLALILVFTNNEVALNANPIYSFEGQQRNVVEVTPNVKACKDNVETLKNDLNALEQYLKDKKKYSSDCKHIKWKQPELNVYKEDRKSYLPERCKK